MGNFSVAVVTPHLIAAFLFSKSTHCAVMGVSTVTVYYWLSWRPASVLMMSSFPLVTAVVARPRGDRSCGEIGEIPEMSTIQI